MERITLMLLAFIPGLNCLALDKLIKDVFADHEHIARPRCGDSQPVEVSIDVALRQIVELVLDQCPSTFVSEIESLFKLYVRSYGVSTELPRQDEPHQFLSCIAWIRLEWRDCRLVWNATEYDNIESVILPQGAIWIPDLTLYDNAADALTGLKDYSLKVKHTGVIRYQFPSVIKSLCAVDVIQFPFDYQECNLTFGSWAYSGLHVDLQNHSETADMTSYVKNVEWHVVSVPVKRIETWYQDEPYPTVTFSIRLQRLPLFYSMNLIFPCALISIVAVFGFLLPPASGEKVNLELTVLLSLAVFQLIVLEMMPPIGDAVPFIGIFFIIALMLVGLSCCMTVLVLKVHFEGNDARPLPSWLKSCCVLPLAKLLCFDKRELRPDKHYKSKERISSRISDGTANSFRLGFPESGASHMAETDILVLDNHVTHQSHAGRSKEDNSVTAKLDAIAGQLNSINEHLSREEDSVAVAAEWKMFAVLLDRLFLIIYIISLVTCGVTYFKYLYNNALPW